MNALTNNAFWLKQPVSPSPSLDSLPVDGLRQNLFLFKAAVEHSPAAMAITDETGRFLYANARFVELTGYAREELADKTLPLTRPGGKSDDSMWRCVRDGKSWRGESCSRRKNGELYRESEVVTPVLDAEGELAGLVLVREDISSQVRAEEHKVCAEALDDLTGLLNSAAFTGAVTEYLRQCRFGCEPFALILFRLDGARSNGEDDGTLDADAGAGDALVAELAKRVRRCLRTRDVLARRSRDEFAVLLPDTRSDRAEVIAERLRYTVASKPLLDRAVTISVGTTWLLPEDELGGLFARADQALYLATTRGGNRVVCCTGDRYW